MDCKFDLNICSPECKKFSLCSYLDIQNQLNNINKQINTLLQTGGYLINELSKLKNQDTELNDKIINYTTEMLKFITDSQPKNIKEDQPYEN